MKTVLGKFQWMGFVAQKRSGRFSGRRIVTTSENILDVARMEEGKRVFELEDTVVRELVSGLVEKFQHQVGYQGFTLHGQISEGLPALQIDRNAMAQALSNLLDNAIKYSGTSKDIEVRAYVNHQHLVVEVEDHGVGIQKEEIEKLFDRDPKRKREWGEVDDRKTDCASPSRDGGGSE